MNKTQKEYLKNKLNKAVQEKISAFTKDKPVAPSTDDKIKALKKAGFVPDYKDEWRYTGYAKLPETAAHKKNKAAIAAYTAKLWGAYHQAEDEIELGDSADALVILAKFKETIEAL